MQPYVRLYYSHQCLNNYLIDTTAVITYIDVVKQSLLGSGASLGLVVQAKPYRDLVVKDECPDKTEDQLQVAIHNVTTP